MKKTLTAQQELKQDYLEKLEKLNQEEKILDLFPNIKGIKKSVFIHSLYQVKADIKYGDSYGFNESLTIEQALSISEKLPGKIVPRYYMKNSCLSLPPAAYYDSLTHEQLDNKYNETFSISSFIINLENGKSILEFYLEIEGFGIVEVGFIFPQHLLCDSYITSKRVDFMGGHRYDNVKAHINDQKIDLENIQVEKPINWGRASNEYEGRKTFYFIPLGGYGADPSLKEFLSPSLKQG